MRSRAKRTQANAVSYGRPSQVRALAVGADDNAGPAATSDATHIAALYAAIYDVVRQIPRGRVLTYGEVAELAGMPGAARVVGTAMRLCQPIHGLPWQRVLGKRGKNLGRVSIHDPVGAGIQRAMLEEEGIEFTATGGVALRDYGWVPE